MEKIFMIAVVAVVSVVIVWLFFDKFMDTILRTHKSHEEAGSDVETAPQQSFTASYDDADCDEPSSGDLVIFEESKKPAVATEESYLPDGAAVKA